VLLLRDLDAPNQQDAKHVYQLLPPFENKCRNFGIQMYLDIFLYVVTFVFRKSCETYFGTEGVHIIYLLKGYSVA
jgi:hypothetical protein